MPFMEHGDDERKAHTTRIAAILVLAALLVSLPALGIRAPQGRTAVATENGAASREAIAVMRRGGSAVDAAITAALVAGVASPSSSGIGGGGFAMVFDTATQDVLVLDFRETAPAAIEPRAFDRRPLEASERGHLVGVPGEVAGLFELHRRFGKLPWKDVVGPAARVARQGFEVGAHVAMVLSFMGKALAVDPTLASLYLPRGGARRAGARVRNPALGATLERIAAEGPKAFYEGAVAAELVAAVQSQGGGLSSADLSSYAPVAREPLRVDWEGNTVFTMPPPSAGGLMLAEALALFRAAELKQLGRGSGAYVHMLSEAARGAMADRMRYVGDPDHQRVDVDALLAPTRMRQRRASLAVDRTHAMPRFGLEEHGTHHLLTADDAGNVVSLTTTVNRPFGARIVAPNSGVVLNDELDDFTDASSVRPFGMVESPNRPRPGARPVSSMTPTIVTRGGKPVLALGGSGGLTIATNVMQLTVDRLVFGTELQALLSAPRLSIPTEGGTIALPRTAAPALVLDLEQRGEVVTTRRFDAHAVQLVAASGEHWRPAADPRKHGVALAR